jgi:hypothetical protein
MRIFQSIGAISLGAFLLLGCDGENITEVSSAETDRSLAERVGPVSQYGELLAGQVDGVGHIYGSCEGIAAGKEVQVRGMSMYWSLLDAATMFYSDAGVSTMVRDMKVEIIRLAIGTVENWGGISGYIKDPDAQRELIKAGVMAAVKNDIYVIIDWHSHTATDQLEEATAFFEEVAQAYGGYNNVIFEIFNEPTNIGWPLIKSYADSIVTVIRKHSDNLILVGNPNWDQRPDVAIGKEVEDPKHNVAYTFHYYAMTHGKSQMNNADRAIKAGLPVFVSEWGTGTADGKGTPGEDKNNMWQEWMDANKLSSANWSASKINEGTAAFAQASKVDSLVFSPSGEMVKGFLAKNPDSYTTCAVAKK